MEVTNNIMETNYDLGIGVLIFNPQDDVMHLERIEKCITSLVSASNNTSKKVQLMFLMNMSVIGKPEVQGVGPATQSLVKRLSEKAKNKILIQERKSPHSMNVKHYAYLQSSLNDAGCAKVVVFADDYIVPIKWIDTVLNEFEEFPAADFITPSTSFVAQTNLIVPIKIKPKWQPSIYNNHVYGITSGISQEDVEEISQKVSSYPTIKYIPSPSFETTVFTNGFLKQHGYVDSRYFSIFYNTEYFKKALSKGAKGYISRKSYVFHYGKGGTAAVEKEKRDEKYKGSPVEKYLLKDIELYNKNTGSCIEPWWGSKEGRYSAPLDNYQRELQMRMYNYRDIGAKILYKWTRIKYKIYSKLKK